MDNFKVCSICNMLKPFFYYYNYIKFFYIQLEKYILVLLSFATDYAKSTIIIIINHLFLIWFEENLEIYAAITMQSYLCSKKGLTIMWQIMQFRFR